MEAAGKTRPAEIPSQTPIERPPNALSRGFVTRICHRTPNGEQEGRCVGFLWVVWSLGTCRCLCVIQCREGGVVGVFAVVCEFVRLFKYESALPGTNICLPTNTETHAHAQTQRHTFMENRIAPRKYAAALNTPEFFIPSALKKQNPK